MVSITCWPVSYFHATVLFYSYKKKIEHGDLSSSCQLQCRLDWILSSWTCQLNSYFYRFSLFDWDGKHQHSWQNSTRTDTDPIETHFWTSFVSFPVAYFFPHINEAIDWLGRLTRFPMWSSAEALPEMNTITSPKTHPPPHCADSIHIFRSLISQSSRPWFRHPGWIRQSETLPMSNSFAGFHLPSCSVFLTNT